MEHSEALTSKAAERYLLGELDDPEAEAFEEHFFECADCAEDVRDEAVMLEAGRSIAREGNEAKVVSIASRKPARWGWLQVAAAAILVIGIGGPLMLTRDARPAVAVGQQATLTLSRAAAENVFTLREGQVLSLYVPVDPRDYRFRVVNAAGEVVKGGAGTVTKADLKDGFNLLLSDLPAGSYTLTMDGVREEDGKPGRIVEQSFKIRR